MGRKAFRKSIKIAAGRAPPKSLGCAMMCDTASCPGVGRDRPPVRQPAAAIHNRDEVLAAAAAHSLALSLTTSPSHRYTHNGFPNPFPPRTVSGQTSERARILDDPRILYIRKHYCIYKKKNATLPLFDLESLLYCTGNISLFYHSWP